MLDLMMGFLIANALFCLGLYWLWEAAQKNQLTTFLCAIFVIAWSYMEVDFHVGNDRAEKFAPPLAALKYISNQVKDIAKE